MKFWLAAINFCTSAPVFAGHRASASAYPSRTIPSGGHDVGVELGLEVAAVVLARYRKSPRTAALDGAVIRAYSAASAIPAAVLVAGPVGPSCTTGEVGVFPVEVDKRANASPTITPIGRERQGRRHTSRHALRRSRSRRSFLPDVTPARAADRGET